MGQNKSEWYLLKNEMLEFRFQRDDAILSEGKILGCNRRSGG